MPRRQLTGTRIRDRRIDRGMRQAELAAAVGVSASYLNLIEHNRRRIGGRLLEAVARVLGTEASALAEGGGGSLIAALRTAAALAPEAGAEVERAEDFAGRFPGWAGLLAETAARADRAEARVAELTDRLAHDPLLAASLHEVISAVTAIRATASILVSSPDIDRDWQARFHRNIRADSLRLADRSRSLIRFLEAPGQGAALSPLEEVERVLQACDHHLPDLEGGPADGSAGPPPGPEAAGEGPAALPPDLSPAGRARLEAWRALYAADAAALPLAPFAAAWGETGDPVAVAHRFGTDVAAVLRRVAALPPAPERPAAGLAIADAAGALMHFKGIEGFSLPRAGAGCPVWPLYEALGQPGRPLRAIASMPGEGGARFLCHAVATLAPPAHFDAPPVVRATMLVLPGAAAPEGLPERPVGPSCRICPRESCPARREPAVLG